MNFLATVLAVPLFIGGLHVATKIRSVHFDVTGKSASVTSGLYALANFVQQNERGFVMNTQIAGQLQRAVTHRTIDKDRDCCQKIANLQLPAGKDCA